MVIRVSPRATRAEQVTEGPWDWVLPVSFPWPQLGELLLHRPMDSKPAVPVRKVLLAGEATVSKTSLVHCYLSRSFQPRRRMTVGVDIHVCPVEVEGMAVRRVVWDVGGQRRFAAFRGSLLSGRDGRRAGVRPQQPPLVRSADPLAAGAPRPCRIHSAAPGGEQSGSAARGLPSGG